MVQILNETANTWEYKVNNNAIMQTLPILCVCENLALSERMLWLLRIESKMVGQLIGHALGDLIPKNLVMTK